MVHTSLALSKWSLGSASVPYLVVLGKYEPSYTCNDVNITTAIKERIHARQCPNPLLANYGNKRAQSFMTVFSSIVSKNKDDDVSLLAMK